MTAVGDPNDLLMGGGGRSAKFEHEGDTVLGYITRVDTRQQTEIGTGALRTWPDGNPRMQLVVQLLTDEREDDDDDGMRNLYVPIPSAMQKAIAEAIRKSGDRGIGVGGRLWVKFTETAAPKQRGFNGQKQYVAKYEQPVMNIGSEEPDPDDAPF